VARALGDPIVAQELVAPEGASQRRGLRYLGRGPHRAPPITDVSVPVPIAPVGIVAEATSLRWASAVGSDRYRVTLFDAGAQVLFETEVADTAVAVPDSVALVPGQTYLWKVEARTGWNRWTTSHLVEFSIGGGGSP
jgi:hypothetical protein